MKALNLVQLLCMLLCFGYGLSSSAQISADEYLQRWEQFYPSKTLQLGLHQSIYHLEDFSQANIQAWINWNEEILQNVDINNYNLSTSDRINLRLMRSQVRKELEKWKTSQTHHHTLTLYTSVLSQALPNIARASFLLPIEKRELFKERISIMPRLISQIRENLHMGKLIDKDRGMKQLQETLSYCRDSMRTFDIFTGSQLDHSLEKLTKDLETLIQEIDENAQSGDLDQQQILGEASYARRLVHYTDSELTPDQLADMARSEIEVTKSLMMEVASQYCKATEAKLKDTSDRMMLQFALQAMEADVTSSSAEYTAFWNNLADSLVDFIHTHDLVTLPSHTTLSITPAPESAGAAARIGWVSSAPPLAADPWTTLYLPSIPDTFPLEDRRDFWASFNKPFNRFIAIHELYPGHYVQLKIARETPHKVRLIFPYGPYIEGWATFVEKILLDAGWDADRPLTRLAHLRKRLENANRAYTSVMVHCKGWDKDEVIRFSTETSLLAPQFAKSLWGRLLRGPMQMTSYFYGGKLFSDLYQSFVENGGDGFRQKDFLDGILRAGAIPIDEFYHLLDKN